MSGGNAERFRQVMVAVNGRDLDAFLELMDPEVEFVPYSLAVQGGDSYRGRDGVRNWWEDIHTVLPDYSSEATEIRELGDVTVVRGRIRASGAASGASFDRDSWVTVEWRQGKVVWLQGFETESEALEAAGRR